MKTWFLGAIVVAVLFAGSWLAWGRQSAGAILLVAGLVGALELLKHKGSPD
jgi:hypothetical protein